VAGTAEPLLIAVIGLLALVIVGLAALALLLRRAIAPRRLSLATPRAHHATRRSGMPRPRRALCRTPAGVEWSAALAVAI